MKKLPFLNLDQAIDTQSHRQIVTRRDFLLGSLALGGLSACSHEKTLDSLIPDIKAPLKAEEYMKIAILAAKQAEQYQFGAVIVERESGQILALGNNHASINPSFHGEIYTISQCAQRYPNIDWSKMDLYTTAEPCPMCQSCIEWAGIKNIYYGSSIPYLISQGWGQIAIRAQEVADSYPASVSIITGGILEEKCNALYALS